MSYPKDISVGDNSNALPHVQVNSISATRELMSIAYLIKGEVIKSFRPGCADYPYLLAEVNL
jgi:hypothetical protein